ncbi:MAG TPA: GAF domain-containing sensor histidine kinase [Puia sp.]|uniref:GAF domain-containing sensor histidine kinase n=1 Tax=Puia sp. TaxID=2045100 RepID=UPI002BF4953F|nr:GAF domain-containing sensor histidine kinase [Puia sp.]HVU98459.1 GAF domain-containing sensor histidine kinase [Puia sp.]
MGSNHTLHVEGMALLVSSIRELSLAEDLAGVMRVVRKTARALTGADGACFVLREGDQCYYADEDAITPLWKGSKFPMSACVSGWAMLHKEAVVIEDIYKDDRIPADAYRPTFVKSLVMVPIRTADPIGAIGNYWSVIRMPSAEEVALLQALADITAVMIDNVQVRSQLERKVTERTQELDDSLQRERRLNETKSAFLSMASHEFRTPLSTILSSISLVESYSRSGETVLTDKHCQRIRSAARNLDNILEGFLCFDKLEQGKVSMKQQAIDLRELLQETVEQLAGIKKPGQEIRFTYEGDTEAMLDATIVRNVTVNLLSNAIKYSGKDIFLNACIQAGQVTLSVRDQGIGIPAGQQRLLFEKFFRASNAGSIQGTGLGLNIVKHYVNLLKGTISFESIEGQGTTFTLQFPNGPAAYFELNPPTGAVAVAG